MGDMRMKKRLLAALLAAVLALAVGCAGKPASNEGTKAAETAESDRIQISMCLWDKSLSRELTPWLQAQFPDIEFSFIVGYNTMAYYTDLRDRDDAIPDIITCRRFSLNDAAHLSDQLMDLSQTEIVGTFYDSYIENNREPGGAIRWLPMCAEVDGYIANLDLFEQYGVPLPTNYAEFVDAIDRFEAVGIRGFATDWEADYTCLEQLQGCAIPELMSLEGSSWRRAYESETDESPVSLDDHVWPRVFERFAQYLSDIRVAPEDIKVEWSAVSSPFLRGEIAMMRATANDCNFIHDNNGINCAMLPYFGETADDSWLLTYPVCQLAVNKKVESDPAKKEAVMKVLAAIFSQEGQERISPSTTVLSYNKTVHIDLSEPLTIVQSCIERNHMYMRLASTEFFTISRKVVRSMIAGEYGEGFGPQAAYADFRARLLDSSASAPGDVLFTQENAYAYSITDAGNPAASSMMNTLRKGTGDDIAIGYSNVVSSPVFKGDYTEQQLKWLMGFKTVVYRAEYTGEEVLALMDWLVNVKEDGSNPIRHRNTIPVTSGIQYAMKDNGDGTYALESVTMNGKPLDKAATYSVTMLGEDDYLQSTVYCNSPLAPELGDRRVKYMVGDELYNSYNTVIGIIVRNGQMEAPSDYVTIHR